MNPPPAAERRRLGGDFHLVILSPSGDQGGETQPPESPATLRVDVGFPHPEWRPRRPERPGRAAFPGSAILLDERWYEVFDVETEDGLPPRHSYTLRPWDDSFPLRRTFELSTEVCERTTAEHWAGRRRQHTADVLGWLPFVTGLLPAEDQDRIERHYGVPAARATAISAGLHLFAGSMVVFLTLAYIRGYHFGAYHGLVKEVVDYVLLFAYLALEALPRLAAGLTGIPVGSLPVAGPIVAVRWLARELRPAASRRATAERAHRRGDRVFADARDEVRQPGPGEHDLEVLSRLPKDHWRANVTGINYQGEVYVLGDRQLVDTADGVRHRFLLLKPRHEVLYTSFCDYRPEEVQDVYRARRRRDAAMWVETLPFLWGFVGAETQLRLDRIYDYDPWRWTRGTIAGAAVVGAILVLAALGQVAEGRQSPADGVGLLGGLFLLWEAALRWRSLRVGEIRSSLLGALLKPLAVRFLRWE